jgi:hypothetical protein
MVALLSGAAGLRYHKRDIIPGAQTERRGDAGPVRVLLGGGHAPAALLSVVRSQSFIGKALVLSGP